MTFLKRPGYVFLIYAHADKSVVQNLYASLVKDGINVWLDKAKLLPGQNWEHEIRKAILGSAAVIVCLSRQFNKQGGYRHRELEIALEKAGWLADDGVFIIPARLEKCDLPKALRHLQRLDLFEVGGQKKLMRALQQYVSAK
jgi:hypothetical protein